MHWCRGCSSRVKLASEVASESIRTRPGHTFEVALREPAATGQRWRRTDLTPEVIVVADRYEPPPAGGPLGNAGRRVITLRAEGRGRYQLEFVLARAGEAHRESEHRLEVNAA